MNVRTNIPSAPPPKLRPMNRRVLLPTAGPVSSSVLRAGLVLVLVSLSAPARNEAQDGLEETDFAGWTTEITTPTPYGTASGATSIEVGNLAPSYAVVHSHRRPVGSESTSTGTVQLTSRSLSPDAVSPHAAGLDDQVRFSLDVRLEIEFPRLDELVLLDLEPLVWVRPVIEQGGRYFRPRANVVEDGFVVARDVWVRFAAVLGPADWTAGEGQPALDVSQAAPEVRVGVELQTFLALFVTEQGTARVRLDNFSVAPASSRPDTADLGVEMCGTEFIGTNELVETQVNGLYRVTVRNHGPEPAIDVHLRVAVSGDEGLAHLSHIERLEPGQEQTEDYFYGAPLNSGDSFGQRASVSSSLPDDNPSNDWADLVTTAVDCDDLDQACPLLQIFAVGICEERLPSSTCPAAPDEGSGLLARAGAGLRRIAAGSIRKLAGAVVDLDLDVFYRLRDEVMRATPAGRHAIELYETHGPEISALIRSDASLRERALETLRMWEGNLRALVEGRGEQAVITAEQITAIEGVLDAIARSAGAELQAVIERERELLDLPSFIGRNMAEARSQAQQRGCQEAETTLCLGGGRFRATVAWRDFEGNSGMGRAVPLTDDTGTFWFFGPDNVELMLKVLDGTALNDRFWVFYGALSNVEYTLEVVDTSTGAVRIYRNPLGELASFADTSAFEGGGSAPGVASPPPAGSSCAADGTRLCLNGDRFEIAVEWRDFDGGSGTARAVRLTNDTGYFWFFEPNNVEVVMKILDGRIVNGRFWVFYAALSNVEYTITVRDRNTGAVKTYRNPSGRLASVADAEAF